MENKVVAVPVIGSGVLIGSLSGDYSNLFILQVDVIDKLDITCNGINLMKLISGLLETISNAKIITPSGTGTFDPIVLASLNNIEKSFEEIFK